MRKRIYAGFKISIAKKLKSEEKLQQNAKFDKNNLRFQTKC